MFKFSIILLIIGINMIGCKCVFIFNRRLIQISIKEYPFMVYISSIKSESDSCSGFLISKVFVITRADCVKNDEEYSVRIASSYKEKNGILVNINKNNIKIHPDYNDIDFSYNFAIIKLPKYDNTKIPVSFLKLPKEDTLNSDGNMVLAIGWDLTNYTEDGHLRIMKTTYFQDCPINYSTEITTTKLCVGIEGQTICHKFWGLINTKFSFVILHGNIDSSDIEAVGFGTWTIIEIPSREICITRKLEVIEHIASVRNWIKKISNI